MLVFTQIGNFETDRVEDEHLSGVVSVVNRPPQNIECPGNYVDDVDIFIIDHDGDADDDGTVRWNGCVAYWDDHRWKIEIQHATKVNNGIEYLIYIARVDPEGNPWVFP